MFCLSRVRWLAEFLRRQDRGEMGREEDGVCVGRTPVFKPLYSVPWREERKREKVCENMREEM